MIHKGTKMKKALSLLLVLSLATFVGGSPNDSPQQQSQSPTQPELTNKDVINMVDAGLGVDVVLAKIRTTPSRFDTSPSILAELKAAGVPDSIITAMVERPTVTNQTTPSSPTGVEVKVPDGTELEIQLQNTLSGQEAKVGDMVDFTILRSIQVEGVTVFEKDSVARARVTTSKKAGRWGKAGKLEWAMQDVLAVDGNRIPARFTKRELGDSKGGTVAVAAVATTVLLGPLGLLWGLKKGKPAIIPAGNRYTIFVHGDTTIKVKPTAGS
jgi:hypothetical protein